MEFTSSCSRVSDGVMCYEYNGINILKNGRTKTGKQQYYCKSCGKRFIATYSYNACRKNLDNEIVQLTKEGLGIRSTARILKISTTTLLRRILYIARRIERPAISTAKTYEVDEMRTFVKRKDKLVWICVRLRQEHKASSYFQYRSKNQ